MLRQSVAFSCLIVSDDEHKGLEIGSEVVGDDAIIIEHIEGPVVHIGVGVPVQIHHVP